MVVVVVSIGVKMTEYLLKPVEAVLCPKDGCFRTTTYCEELCGDFTERRRPWRHWAIKCNPEGASTGSDKNG